MNMSEDILERLGAEFIERVDANVDEMHQVREQMEELGTELIALKASQDSHTISKEQFIQQADILLERAKQIRLREAEVRSKVKQTSGMTSAFHRSYVSAQKIRAVFGENAAKVLADHGESLMPQTFAKFYPRRYHDIETYYSPKLAAGALTYIVSSFDKVDMSQVGIAHQTLLPALDFLVEKRMPTFFIAPAMMEALKRTDFKDDIDWQALKLPFEHGCFMLPKGSLTHPDGTQCCCIFWTRIWKDQAYPARIIDLARHLQYGMNSFSLVSWSENGCFLSHNVTDKDRPTVRIRNLFNPNCVVETHGLGDEDLRESDTQFLEDLGCIAYGMLLALNARPTLRTDGVRAKRVAGKHGKPDTEYWTPNVLGKDYKPKTEPAQGGSHMSPRMHWRRGHFRKQAHGLNRSERKIIWLEPMLVAAPKEGQ